ncbi:Ger(x)C family spore germination protein [Paenibacillus glycanilyticus]|uniref:Ger(x)C family spore germination protein n=1 Tax=Paenibacillus glycanilyticus TaxID=126569 RepID=UPI00190FC8E8|nr:Ger(x)C family spore germination protein [Paenibacillus glycanilyticus]
MRRHAVVLLCCCILLSGCAQERVVDQINILQYMGVDLEDEKFKLNASYPEYIKASGGQSLVTTESNVIYGVYTALTSKSSQPVEMGQMRTLVLNENFAGKYIAEIADIINRQFTKSTRASIVLTDQSTYTIIAEASKKPPFFLSELIDQNMDHGNTPNTNYHTFINQYYGEGQDIYLPVIRVNKGLFQMDGVSVFRGDDLKLRLNANEGLYLKLLKDKKLAGEYDFIAGTHSMYSFIILHGKSKINVKEDGRQAAISLALSIQLRETPKQMNIQSQGDLNEMKKQIEEKLSSEITTLLIRLKQNRVDPIGFGEKYRRQHQAFKEKEYYEKIYPHLLFEVKTDVHILHAGVGQ